MGEGSGVFWGMINGKKFCLVRRLVERVRNCILFVRKKAKFLLRQGRRLKLRKLCRLKVLEDTIFFGGIL